MQFRALILDNGSMRDFANICVSLSKFAKSCVLRLTTKKLCFIISDENAGPKHPIVWCVLPVAFYFKDYNLVGLSTKDNEIYLELSTGLLAKSCSIVKHDIKSFKLKLTDKETTCLTLEIEMPAADNISYRQCVHDIPVEIIGKKFWEDYQEPEFNEFDVTLQLPNLKFLKNIIERMKNISQYLTIRANNEGKLSFEIKTSNVKLAAHFTDLPVNGFIEPENLSDSDDDNDENSKTISSTMDIKKFIMFLSGMQLNNCHAYCSIVQRKLIKLSMEQPGALLLQIYLPEVSV